MCNCKNKTVIVIDDDKIFLEIIKNELIQMNILNVRAFLSAEKALSIKNLNPDLIILDYHLNNGSNDNISGHSALNVVENKFPDSNIMLISGTCHEELLSQYEEYRKVAYCVKHHLNFNGFRNKVNNLLKIA